MLLLKCFQRKKIKKKPDDLVSQTIKYLFQKVVNECRRITPEMFQNVRDNLNRRFTLWGFLIITISRISK